jgi:hypothetical protein
MMIVYATPHAPMALLVKAVLTPDVRMKPRPICVLLKPMSPSCRVRLSTVLLELPVSVVQWADLARLEPSGDAVEVESVLSCISTRHMS